MLQKKCAWRQQHRGILYSVLVLIGLFGSTIIAQATHFRGGTLSWQQAGGNTIHFTLNTSWRRGYFITNQGVTTNVGTTVNLGVPITFGDGSNSGTVIATVTSSDPVTDIITTTYTADRTYNTSGNFTAIFTSCCRLSTLQDNNHDQTFTLTTTANVGGSPLNNPPVSGLPPIVNIPIGSSTNLFTIPASDPDGDPITFRLSTTSESGLVTLAPNLFTLNANGTFTMNTTGISSLNLYAIQFMMEDHVGTASGPVKSKVPVDVLIQLVPFSNPPTFVSPTPLSPNNVFNVLPGNTVSFTVAATDPDAGQNVTLNPVSLPIGASMSPTLPVVGPTNGTASSTFSWTPTAGQVGTNVINFVASDNLSVQAVTSVTVNVLCALDATAAITPNACIGQSNGAIDVTVSNFSTAANLTYIWSGPGSFAASTQDVTGLVAGNYSVRIDDHATGCFVIKNYTVNNTLTITPVANNSGPVCEGGTLNLSGSGASNLTWTGPNSFVASGATPSIPNATIAASGTYTLTATDATTGCFATATTAALVKPNPAIPIITADGPTTFCNGSAVTLSSHTPTHSASPIIAGTATGAPVTCDCPAGSVAVGYKGRTGSWIDQFQFACKHLNSDGTLGSTITYTNANGTSNGGGAVGDILSTGTNVIVGLDADAFNSTVGNFIKSITGLDQSTSYIAGAGSNSTGYISIAPFAGVGGCCSGVTNHIGTVIVPDGNMVVGMSSYNNDGYSKGIVLHYNNTNEVTGADLTWSNSTTGPSITVSTAGQYTVTVTAANGCTATSAPTTIVVNTPPTITCSGNISASTDPGVCTAIVNYPNATATGVPSPTISYTQASGTSFASGTTTVTASANNICGTVSCSFDVAVTDHEAPVPNLAQLATITGECSAASVSAPTAIDNCSGTITGTTTDPLSYTAQGTYSIHWTYDDGHGNTSTQTQSVVVHDITPPVANVSNLPAVQSECTVGPVSPPTATDNCSGTITGTTTDPLTYLNQGTYTIHWVYDDGHGNTSSQTQSVIVHDVTPPVITCAPAVTINNTPGLCSGTTTLVAPTVSDNCSEFGTASELVSNGNFNSGATSWNACGNTVEAYGTELNYGGTDGNNHVAEIDHQPVTLCQTINGLEVGKKYTLSFKATRRVGAPSTVGATISIDGGAFSATVNRSNPTFNLTPESFTFIATQTTHQLTFTPTSGWSGTLGLIVDDISVKKLIKGTVTNNAPAIFQQGNTTVTWTADDGSGNTSTCTQVVTVVDNEKPVITASTVPPNVTVSCSSIPAPGMPSATDNCTANPAVHYLGQVSTQGTNPMNANYYNYTLTRNWDATDGSNNHSLVATQVITVQDIIAPTFTAPANTTIYTTANCTYNASPAVTGDVTNEMDNCATGLQATYSDIITNGSCTGAKVITRTWHLVDYSNNAAPDQVQVINVLDNTPPTFTVTPQNITACNDQAGNSKSLAVVAADNCSTPTVTYTITGATTGSGTGSIVNKSFAIGTSVVHWTVKDACNNTTTGSSTIIINPLPVASYTTSTADAFCNAVTVTGAASPAGMNTYLWKYNNANFATTPVIRLNVSNNDGNYVLVVTDGNGCSSNPVTYNYQKQTLLSSYALIGFKHVELAQDNDVHNGSVGVTSLHGEAEFDSYCSVSSPGAFVKAYDIDVSSNVTIPTKITSAAAVGLPTMLLNTSNTNGLSNYVKTTSGTVTGNYKDLTISSNKTVTITGNIFRNLHIMSGASVTFTATDISMYSLDMETGSTIYFSDNTNIRVTENVEIDKACTVNPTGKKVTFYVKDASTTSYNCQNDYHYWRNGNDGDDVFDVQGQNTKVIANVYIPDGKLITHGNGYGGCNWGNSDSCTMVGMFIAEEIESDGKNIGWYTYDCNNPQLRMAPAPVSAIQEETTDNGLMIFPNPTTGEFTLQFSQMKEAATVRILDIQGRVVSGKTIPAESSLSTTMDITNQPSGIYIIEVTQGVDVFRTRLIRR